MDPAAAFFLLVLLVQASFSGVLVWIVVRRFPQRAALYRFLAPAAVPVLLFTVVSSYFLSFVRQQGRSFGTSEAGAIFRFFLAYAVLWLIGVLIASAVIRWNRR